MWAFNSLWNFSSILACCSLAWKKQNTKKTITRVSFELNLECLPNAKIKNSVLKVEVKIKTPLQLKSVVMIGMNYLKDKMIDIFTLKQSS